MKPYLKSVPGNLFFYEMKDFQGHEIKSNDMKSVRLGVPVACQQETDHKVGDITPTASGMASPALGINVSLQLPVPPNDHPTSQASSYLEPLLMRMLSRMVKVQ